ncbi:hypothetical protein K488DRAFT_55893 [Vararia minispora EC-137]|uniref:Uncharacterized protein n=1 Tax=Vararia minispora EC-137 TaxID=1314806 RepID=A0ACB8QD43_9AGAM|nr:hypothetical protein K488DRAFT_55893 [Vararia minispora EC-137]
MFFPVARLRFAAGAVLALLPVASAHIDSLFASSVSYCAPPESLLVQQFDIAYYPHNNSVVFNVTAASVQSNVNVSANLYLNVYGMQPVNLTIDLCTLLNSALCPLPLYDFQGADTLPLPQSVDISTRLPGIAYKIPDLEAFAQLTLFDVDTNQQKACIQVTLANGWSTRQPGVSWATGGLALLTLTSAAWQSFTPDALAPFRLLDLLGLYQIIAASALLNLNYPVIYRSFALNFSWALGLFDQSLTSSIQTSIDHMRNITGGHVSSPTTGGATALVNRKTSPYNLFSTSRGAVNALAPQFLSRNSTIQHLAARDVKVVTPTSNNILGEGLPVYAETMNIATGNAFMTAFFSALILLAIAVAVLAIVYGAIWLGSRWPSRHQARFVSVLESQPTVMRSWLFRVALVCFFPLIVLAFYQWTLDDSWLAVLISVITFLVVTGVVAYGVVRVLLYTRRSSPDFLNMDLPSFVAFYGQYRVPRQYAFLIPISAAFLRALFIAFAKGSETAQIALMLAVETFSLIALCVLRPGKTRRADVLAIYLAVVRFVCTGLLIAFLQRIAVTPIPRVAIGIITAVIWSVTVIIMFFNTLWNLGLRTLWRRRSEWRNMRLGSTTSASRSSQSFPEPLREKGGSTTSFDVLGRRNPTPSRQAPLDPSINKPYPTVTPTTTAAEPTSASTATSYGEQIESKWQSPSRPQSVYSSSMYTGTPQSSALGVTPPSANGCTLHPPIAEDRAI